MQAQALLLARIARRADARRARMMPAPLPAGWPGEFCDSPAAPRVAPPGARPPAVCTPLMAEIERILRRIATAASPMPNYAVLGELAGGRGRSSALRALQRLERAGRLRIEMSPDRRRRRVVFCTPFVATAPIATAPIATAPIATAWGETRPGHAPFSADLSQRDLPPALRRRPESLPLASAAPVQTPLNVGPARTCQWPLWPDGARPTHRFCEAPSLAGRSWCASHNQACFERSAP